MGISTFDTLQFVRRLEKAGVSTEQAEVQAALLTEAFTVNLDSLMTKLVTKEFLAARLAELKADFDVKLRVLTVLTAIILAAVVIPYLERLAVL